MARDIIHNAVKNALIKDGWTITADPLRLKYEKVEMLIDLAAEEAIAAEKENQKIAVEIKSFLDPSLMNDLKLTLGQYIIYSTYLKLIEPERTLFVAVSEETYDRLTSVEGLEIVLRKEQMPFIVVNLKKEDIVEWITSGTNTNN